GGASGGAEAQARVAAPGAAETLGPEVAGGVQLPQVLAQYRIGDAQQVAQLGEFGPLGRGQARADAQPYRGVDQRIESLWFSGRAHGRPSAGPAPAPGACAAGRTRTRRKR